MEIDLFCHFKLQICGTGFGIITAYLHFIYEGVDFNFAQNLQALEGDVSVTIVLRPQKGKEIKFGPFIDSKQ